MRATLLRLFERLPARVRHLVKRLPGSGRLRGVAAGKPRGPAPETGTLRPVVYLPTWARWDVMRQRPQFLLEAFAAAGHPVYFVDPREPAPRRSGRVTIVPSMEAVPGEHVILYLHFAPLQQITGRFRDAVVIYDVLDDLTIYEEDEVGLPAERTVAHHHPLLMRRADHVIVSNPVLLERHSTERSDLILVENGVDAARFAEPAERPRDLPAPGEPVIGYRGAVARWIDFSLVRTVAIAEPGWRFVFVGPIDERVAADAASLSDLPNVEFLGERTSDLMPAYARAFDVEAIWFVVDELTEGVTPLKMFESLAAGTPVVSSRLPACVDHPLVRTAGTREEFRTEITAALLDARNPDWVAGARAAGAAADWDLRIAPLLERLDESNGRIVP